MPKRSYGFTLVELMVVITIIAILSVVGVTVFSGVQKSARDTKRRVDVDAIAKALEVNKTSSYQVLNDTWFANGKVPFDPVAGGYQIQAPGCGDQTLADAHRISAGTALKLRPDIARIVLIHG